MEKQISKNTKKEDAIRRCTKGYECNFTVKEYKKKLAFENLTMAPIEKDLIIQEKLNKSEKDWLNKYHKTVFKNLRKLMNKSEALELKKACSAI